jgi:hypothetical protein
MVPFAVKNTDFASDIFIVIMGSSAAVFSYQLKEQN